MAHLEWTNDLNTGIDVIDGQHRRLVEYVNHLYDAWRRGDRRGIAAVIEDTVDYTLSHFGFEEALMEDAHYEFVRPHKKVHELFVRRVAELQSRFKAGDDVAEELHRLLSRWLLSHIRNDDRGYINAVMANMKPEVVIVKEEKSGWLSKTVGRFFR